MATILIVDDCGPMRLVIQRIIGISGFAVEACHFAGDGEEALEIMRHHPIDLVISDVNMPRLDGESMVRRMRDDEKLRRVPVVIVSSNANESHANRLLELGAKDYIVKPFQPRILRERLERVLEVAHA